MSDLCSSKAKGLRVAKEIGAVSLAEYSKYPPQGLPVLYTGCVGSIAIADPIAPWLANRVLAMAPLRLISILKWSSSNRGFRRMPAVYLSRLSVFKMPFWL